MPAKIFADDFEKTLKNEVITKTVEETGDTATKFWLGYFEKKKRNQETQTISMQEILDVAEEKARAYEKKFLAADKRLDNYAAEMGKIARNGT